MKAIVMAYTDISISKFVIFNSIFPSLDTVTDVVTFSDLLERQHVFWAGVTAAWMFSPLITRLVSVLYMWLHSVYAGKQFSALNGFKDSLKYAPLVGPFKMLVLAYQLRKKTKREKQEWLEKERKKKIESIFDEANSLGLYKAYLGNFPTFENGMIKFLYPQFLHKLKCIIFIFFFSCNIS